MLDLTPGRGDHELVAELYGSVLKTLLCKRTTRDLFHVSMYVVIISIMVGLV